ncbi:hypothetical protein [Micromonospora sp. NPDC048830]|uniref:hypothetical protein n=1 Tax=Micromonospora sp. NPDC048830 TaxID=3364257 RepID=UPI00370FF0D5
MTRLGVSTDPPTQQRRLRWRLPMVFAGVGVTQIGEIESGVFRPYSHGMRPHVYGIIAKSVLMIALVAGCGGGVGPNDQASSLPGVVVSPSPGTPSPSVALQVPHSLVFSARGDADVVSIIYEFDGEKSTERPASLPWRKVVEVPADGKQHRWNLTLKHGGGHAELIVIFDGSVAGQTQGAESGDGALEVGGTVRG